MINPSFLTGLSAQYEHRVYLDNNAQTWVVVDEEDYAFFSRWCWHINKPHPTRNGTKQYARRSRSCGGRYLPPLYLHIEIMKRTGEPPPSLFHVLVDHRDGDEFNCRRYNLRWATHSMNNKNRRRC